MMTDSSRWIWLSSFALLGLVLCEVCLAQADPRQDYRELARVLSQDYLLDHAQVAEEPVKPNVQRLSKSAGEKGVQRAAALLLKGIEVFDEQKLAAEQEKKDRVRRAEETLEAARRGELTRTVTYVDTDGRQREYEVDDSFPSVFFASNVLAGDGPKDPRIEALKRRIALDSSRARSWDELLPVLPEKFAGPLAQKPLVKIEFLGDGPDGRPLSDTVPRYEDCLPCRSTFLGRYVARNVAGRDLHNVTLAVDMYHYSTLPDATLRHVYFVPVWKKDATLEFSRTFAADPKRGGKKYAVPLEQAPGGVGWLVASELQMMAGVVRMQATVWSDEARQAPTKVELPDRARIVAARLVELAEQRVAADTFPGISKLMHRLALDDLLRPVLAFLPAEADLAKRAQRLLDDFESVRTELLKKADETLLAACAEGQRYTGRWFAPGVTGQLALLFISCDASGKRIRAELFDPHKPERRRLLAGFIARKMIMLEPLFPDKGGDTKILDSSVKSYRFKLEQGQLLGEGSRNDLEQASYDGDQKRITLKSAPGDAKELAEAKKRNQAAPSAQPREPFAESVRDLRPVPLAEARRREDEFGAALILSAVGKYAEAKRAFEKIIADYPGTPSADAAQERIKELNDRLAAATARSASPSMPAEPPPAKSPPAAAPGRNPLFGSSPLGGPSPTASPGGAAEPKKLTPAERRAKAQADARNEKLALQSLALGKQAIAKKDLDVAKVHLRHAITIAPESNAARQAQKLLKNLGDE